MEAQWASVKDEGGWKVALAQFAALFDSERRARELLLNSKRARGESLSNFLARLEQYRVVANFGDFALVRTSFLTKVDRSVVVSLGSSEVSTFEKMFKALVKRDELWLLHEGEREEDHDWTRRRTVGGM